MRLHSRTIYVVIGAAATLAAIGYASWLTKQHHATNLSMQTFTIASGASSAEARPIGGVTAALPGTGAAAAAQAASPSSWRTYANSKYGFQFRYPPTWQLSTLGLENDTPFVAVGSPFHGMNNYTLDVFILPNPHHNNATQFVAAMLKQDEAADQAAEKNGDAPINTPDYTSKGEVILGAYDAYELNGVDQADQTSEQIYIPGNNVVLEFDFPTSEKNPNLWAPAANNPIAHQILQTLMFTPPKS